MEILFSIAAKVAEYTVEPIGRQLGYLFSYKQNVEDLKTKIVDLGHVKERLQHEVDEAQRNGENIEADINDWFTKVDQIITEDHENFTREEEQANTKFICGANLPNLVYRHRLSRRAKKMALNVAAQIQDREKFKKVSYRPNLQSSVGNKAYEEFESRSRTLTDVMEALRDPSVGMVGVWGMGGVGKTMLAKEVARRAMDEEKLFTMTVFTAISNDQNIEKVQQEIGEKLGMQLHEVNKDVRAERLRNRLGQEKKILIIIDDIWDKLDLEEVGISFGSDQKGCKILLTTRSHHVLDSDMDVHRNVIFDVGNLLEHEAMRLFCNNVGNLAERHDDDFQDLATQIVKECGGLPIAITTVASALKNKGIAVWRNALQELKKSNPINIQGMHQKVYTSIKLSYDALESEEAKHLLLLCSLFPEDAEIEIRVLRDYGFGLNLFEDVNTLEEARNKTDTLVTNLKDHSLLLDLDADGYGHDCVKLHDIIRDVVIFIASKLDDHHRMHNIRNADELEKYFNKEMFKDSTAIALYGIKADQYPQTLKSPELNLLRLLSSYEELPHQFFEGLNKLLLLDSVSACLTSLSAASSFCPFPNLQTLCLTGCTLGDISWIGELKNLKIINLSFTSITELPRGIGNLNRLLSLNLEWCGNLKVIEPNVISSLTRLEELNLKGSFTNWEVEGVANARNERRNANLSEVKKLRHLVDLKLEVPDINSLPKDIFSEKLEKYYIIIGEIHPNYYRRSFDAINNTSRTLKLKLSPNSVSNEHEFEVLLGRCTALYLNGLKSAKSLAFEIDTTGFQHLKHLEIRESNEIRCIVDNNNGNVENQPAAFPILESLFLRKLINLENIISHKKLTTETSFGKLREIDVYDCDKLKSLFPLFNIPTQLRSIRVCNCKMMEEIISHHGREGDHVQKIEISQLILKRLPKLVQFIATGKSDEIKSEGQSIDAPLFRGQVVFPKLEELYIDSLNIQKIWNDDQLPSSRFGFQSLTIIDVCNCDHLKGLIPSCITASLVHLQSLSVKSCKAMKEIVFIEKSAQEMRNYISFPKLESLKLYGLPNLERFCEGDISFPKLESFELDFLPNLEKFCEGHISFSKLESLKLCDLPKLERFCEGDISFSKLESLQLHGLPNLERFCGGDFSSPQLESLLLDGLPNLERFCGGDYVDCPSLSKLNIRGCQKLRVFITNTMPTTTTEKEDENSMGSVADKQHLSGSHHKDVVKVELNTESEITCQPHPLGSVEQHDDIMVFKTKRLSRLSLWNFPNQQQLPKTIHTVELLSIAEWGIRLNDLATPLTCFQNLKVLKVKDCHGLTSLLSPSTAKCLSQQLTQLAISGCTSLRQVIANDDKEADDDEIVAAGNINIIFSKLECLVLDDLSSLTSFYWGNNNVVLQFPRLNELIVGDCPEMKIFYHGNIHCPSLHQITLCESIPVPITEFMWDGVREFMWDDYISIPQNNSYWKGDINTAIQQLWEENDILRDSLES